jgi:hypothetical protein
VDLKGALEICGLPTKTVRDALKKLADEEFSKSTLTAALGVSPGAAKASISQMLQTGLIAEVKGEKRAKGPSLSGCSAPETNRVT